jgi:anaerobic magnesium-protoporphyrin IX monomethyl ester cyclase
VDRFRFSAPRFLLLYPPLQFAPGEVAKPDGSLSLAYVAGALRRAGYEVRILDCAVGANHQPLEQTFFNVIPARNGLRRVGLAMDRILEIAASYDVIGLSSIFTPQTSPCLQVAEAIREALPDKLILAGGVNARSLRKRFFASGVDLIALSEAEDTIVQIARALEGHGRISEIPGIAFLAETGAGEVVNRPGAVLASLDELPVPAWDLLPLDQYWKISRPHGGNFKPDETVRYASLQTSRGCPFHCTYCHISKEQKDGEGGYIGALRLKSVDRVVHELATLKELGAQQIFIEDDSLLAKKSRAMRLFELIAGMGLSLLDVNGVNLCHLFVNKHGKRQVDFELIEAMARAGFTTIALPFESASQRIIDKYASGKRTVDPTGADTADLIPAFNAVGIRVSGNYMIGYPDETVREVYETIRSARRHVDQGLDYVLFFNVVPFPGSALFEMAVRENYLDPDFDPDLMRWTKTIMRNLAMDADTLERVRDLAWFIVNRPDYVDYKIGMTMAPDLTKPPEALVQLRASAPAAKPAG